VFSFFNPFHTVITEDLVVDDPPVVSFSTTYEWDLTVVPTPEPENFWLLLACSLALLWMKFKKQ